MVNAVPRLTRGHTIVFPYFRINPNVEGHIKGTQSPYLYFYNYRWEKTVRVKGATGLLYDYEDSYQNPIQKNQCILRVSAAMADDEKRLCTNEGIKSAYIEFQALEVPKYYNVMVDIDERSESDRLIDLKGRTTGSHDLHREARAKTWKSIKSRFNGWIEVQGGSEFETAEELYGGYLTEYENIRNFEDQRPIMIVKRVMSDRTEVEILNIEGPDRIKH